MLIFKFAKLDRYIYTYIFGCLLLFEIKAVKSSYYFYILVLEVFVERARLANEMSLFPENKAFITTVLHNRRSYTKLNLVFFGQSNWCERVT